VAVASMRELLERPPMRSTVAVALLVVAISSAWALRSAGLHFKLLHGAFDARGGWAAVLPLDRRGEWPQDPRVTSLLMRLKQEALTPRTIAATALPPRYQRVWGQD
jgi:hypothetical protein